MSNAMLIGMREITFESESGRDGYIKYLGELKEFENIPTLVKILSYEVKNGNKGLNKHSSTNHA